MPKSVKILPNASHGVTFKQYRKEYPNTAKAILKSIWKNDTILAIPHYHTPKPPVEPPRTLRPKRVEGDLRLVDDSEFLFRKDPLQGGYGYWEDHRDDLFHKEGFDYKEWDAPDHYTVYRYVRYSRRQNLLHGWTTYVYRQAVGSGFTPSEFTPAPPPSASAPVQTPRPPANVPVTVAPSNQGYGTVPPVTFTPRANDPPRAAGAGRDAGGFSYAPFRGFVQQPRKPARRGSGVVRSRLRYSDLYPRERVCVRTKLGGWAAFSKLPYSQQIVALRRCLRARS